MEALTMVSPRYPPYIGGIETHVSELAWRARARFEKISVITTDPLGQLPHAQHLRDGFDVIRVRSFAPGDNYHLPWIPEFLKRLKECSSKILHVHGIQDLAGPIAALSGSDTVILTPHFSGVQSRLRKFLFTAYRPIMNQIVRRVSAVICVSHYEAELLTEVLPWSMGKIHVIPNGVDLELGSKYRWKPPDNPTILFAGRLEKHKNVDLLIRAFNRLHKLDSRLTLTIVGQGPMKTRLIQLASRTGLENSMRWFDGVSREKLFEIYSKSSVVVLPSDLECFGLVPAEAISLGVPTIVTYSSALADFVDSGLAQPVEPPVTWEKIDSKLSEVLQDPESYSPRADTADQILSWQEVATKTFDLYESAREDYH